MYNKVTMIGNLTRDIELRYLPSGSAVAKSAIATSHKYKTQTGEQKDEVCFLDFSVFGKPAEILNQYVRKGSKVLLEGRLVLEQWTAQDGSKRSKHTLRVETFKFMDTKADSANLQQQGGNGGGGYNNEYSQPQQQIQQPAQQQQQSYSQNNSYDNNYNNTPQANNYGHQNNNHQEQKIPEINVEDEEIPF
jgi:single-strand DNA-binding protein